MLAKLKGFASCAAFTTLSCYMMYLLMHNYAPPVEAITLFVFIGALSGFVIALRNGRQAILTGAFTVATSTVLLQFVALMWSFEPPDVDAHLRMLVVGFIVGINGAVGGIGYKLASGWGSASPPNRIS